MKNVAKTLPYDVLKLIYEVFEDDWKALPPEKLEDYWKLMNSAQIKEIADNPLFTIGAHGETHVYRVSGKVVQKIKYKLYAVSLPLTFLGGLAIWCIMEFFVKLGFTYEYYIVGGLIALPCYFYTLNIMELMKHHKERTIICISFIAIFVNIILIFFLIESYEVFGVLLSACITQWVVLLAYKIHRRLVSEKN